MGINKLSKSFLFLKVLLSFWKTVDKRKNDDYTLTNDHQFVGWNMKKEDTKQKILEKAPELFSSKGYDAFGITEKDGMWVYPAEHVKIW